MSILLTIGDAVLNIIGDSRGLELSIARLQGTSLSRVRSVETSVQGVTRSFTRMGEVGASSLTRAQAGFSSFLGILGRVSAALGGVGFAAAATGSIRLAANLEQATIAFSTMLGSGEKARLFLDQLANFAASTPFEFTGLQESSRLLLAFGFQAENILPIMGRVGDAVAALGGGEVEINRVVRALGQIQTKGKVSAEELNQLAEIGIGGYQILGEKLGLTAAQLGDIGNQGISASVGITAILEGLGERFSGAMAAQSQTLNGLFSTLRDNVTLTLTDLGTRAVEALDLKGVVQSFIGFTGNIRTALEQGGISGLLGQYKDQLGLLAATAAGPVVAALGSMAVAAGVALAPFAALAAAGAGLYLAWKSNFLGLGDLVNGTLSGIREGIGSVVERINASYGSLDNYKARWGEAFSLVGQKANEWYEGTRNAVQNSLDALRESNPKAASYLGGLGEMFGKTVQAIGNAFVQLPNYIIATVDSANELGTAFARIFGEGGIGLILKGFGTLLWGYVVEPFQNLVAPVAEAAARVGQVVSNWASKVATFFKPFTDFLRSIGRSIGDAFGTVASTTVSSLTDELKTGISDSAATLATFTATSSTVQRGFAEVHGGLGGIVNAASDAQSALGKNLSDLQANSQQAADAGSNLAAANTEVATTAESAASGAINLAKGTAATGDAADAAAEAEKRLKQAVEERTKDAQTWVTRLNDEVVTGGKTAAQAAELILPVYDRVKANMARMLEAGVYDGEEYLVAKGRLEILEQALTTFLGTPKDITVNVKVGVGPDPQIEIQDTAQRSLNKSVNEGVEAFRQQDAVLKQLGLAVATEETNTLAASQAAAARKAAEANDSWLVLKETQDDYGGSAKLTADQTNALVGVLGDVRHGLEETAAHFKLTGDATAKTASDVQTYQSAIDTLIKAGFDPLSSQVQEYVQKLKAASDANKIAADTTEAYKDRVKLVNATVGDAKKAIADTDFSKLTEGGPEAVKSYLAELKKLLTVLESLQKANPQLFNKLGGAETLANLKTLVGQVEDVGNASEALQTKTKLLKETFTQLINVLGDLAHAWVENGNLTKDQADIMNTEISALQSTISNLASGNVVGAIGSIVGGVIQGFVGLFQIFTQGTELAGEELGQYNDAVQKYGADIADRFIELDKLGRKTFDENALAQYEQGLSRVADQADRVSKAIDDTAHSMESVQDTQLSAAEDTLSAKMNRQGGGYSLNDIFQEQNLAIGRAAQDRDNAYKDAAELDAAGQHELANARRAAADESYQAEISNINVNAHDRADAIGQDSEAFGAALDANSTKAQSEWQDYWNADANYQVEARRKAREYERRENAVMNSDRYAELLKAGVPEQEAYRQASADLGYTLDETTGFLVTKEEQAGQDRAAGSENAGSLAAQGLQTGTATELGAIGDRASQLTNALGLANTLLSAAGANTGLADALSASSSSFLSTLGTNANNEVSAIVARGNLLSKAIIATANQGANAQIVGGKTLVDSVYNATKGQLDQVGLSANSLAQNIVGSSNFVIKNDVAAAAGKSAQFLRGGQAQSDSLFSAYKGAIETAVSGNNALAQAVAGTYNALSSLKKGVVQNVLNAALGSISGGGLISNIGKYYAGAIGNKATIKAGKEASNNLLDAGSFTSDELNKVYDPNSEKAKKGGQAKNGQGSQAKTKDDASPAKGSLDWYEEEIRKLQDKQGKATSAREYQRLDDQIKNFQAKIDDITGKGTASAIKGSLDWYEGEVKKLQDKQSKATTPQQFAQLQSQIDTYQKQMDKIKGVGAGSAAGSIAYYNDLLSEKRKEFEETTDAGARASLGAEITQLETTIGELQKAGEAGKSILDTVRETFKLGTEDFAGTFESAMHAADFESFTDNFHEALRKKITDAIIQGQNDAADYQGLSDMASQALADGTVTQGELDALQTEADRVAESKRGTFDLLDSLTLFGDKLSDTAGGMSDLNAELSNVPSGLKLARMRYSVADAVEPAAPPAVTTPTVPAITQPDTSRYTLSAQVGKETFSISDPSTMNPRSSALNASVPDLSLSTQAGAFDISARLENVLRDIADNGGIKISEAKFYGVTDVGELFSKLEQYKGVRSGRQSGSTASR